MQEKKYLYIDKKQRVPIDGKLPRRVTRILEEFQKASHQADFCYLDQIEINLNSGEIQILANGHDIKEYSHILLGGHVTTTQYELKQFMIDYTENLVCDSRPVVQNAKALKKLPYYNKLYMAKFFIDNSIPHMKGYYTGGNLHLPLAIDYPLIAKSYDGTNRIQQIGNKEVVKKDIYKITSDQEWSDDRLIKARIADYFIQEFSDAGEDFRLFVSKSQFIGGWKRKAATSEFLTVGKNSVYTYYNSPSQEMKNLAEDVAKKLEADFVAVDIINKDNKPYILEISLNPGFHAYENKCQNGEPANIAKAIIESFPED
ncbi:hypothetical protein KC622_03350 [Candidatus Dojkabacteria bacterium]|uniref:ATP-grasp fold RimK-type domain-containing protein n=1 Tax=Candidatus Dojkabacteria bacterium TaxID=2099670 RepID=A0A955HXS7_9BACT|nr:hypothetical protein [Candidatus Dojkabacteria bacterium]